MAKTEDFQPLAAVAETKSNSESNALYEGAYVQRVADDGRQWTSTPTGLDWRTSSGGSNWPRPTVVRDWRQPPAWQPDGTMHRPTNEPQWSGNRFDSSRGPGGSIYQPRPPFVGGGENPIPSGTVPHVAPGALDATRVMPNSENGKQQGPIIITGDGRTNTGPGIYVTQPRDGSPSTPANRGTPGGLIDRDGDGKLEDERSAFGRGRAELDALGFIAGCLIGAAKGGFKGAAFGALLGVVAAEVVRPLNPFK